jgi:hypothetical protein
MRENWTMRENRSRFQKIKEGGGEQYSLCCKCSDLALLGQFFFPSVTIFLRHFSRVPHSSLCCSLSIASHYVVLFFFTFEVIDNDSAEGCAYDGRVKATLHTLPHESVHCAKIPPRLGRWIEDPSSNHWLPSRSANQYVDAAQMILNHLHDNRPSLSWIPCCLAHHRRMVRSAASVVLPPLFRRRSSSLGSPPWACLHW